MAELLKNTFLSVLLCVLFSCSIYTEDEICIEQTPCLCKFNDDRYIDISHVVTKDSPFLTVTYQEAHYFFYPCIDDKFNGSQHNLNVNKSINAPSNGTSLCLYNTTDQSLVNLGRTKDMKFSRGFPKSLNFASEGGKSVITLQCAPNTPVSYLIVNTQKEKQYELTLFSSHACIQTEHRGLSTGSTLLVMFCTAFGIYLLGGALVLHCLRGARGKEMIPNLDFWVDLPYLVRDGTIFLLSGCNPVTISSVETYDRI